MIWPPGVKAAPVLVLLLLHLESGFAQSALEKNSFYKLTFGSRLEETPGSLQLDLVISYGLKYYKYKSKNHKK
ncbi:MAG: hypothetical protein AAF519_15525, partial [Bacteroidota bacterium]